LGPTSFTLTWYDLTRSIGDTDDIGITLDLFATLVGGSAGAVPDTRQVIAGPGLDGGGPLSSDVTLSLEPTGVPVGIYGDALHVAAFQLDSLGRIVGAASIPIDATGNVPSTRKIDTTAPLLGGGDLSVNRVHSIQTGGIDTSLLGNDSVTTTKILDKAVTNAKLADMAAATVKGRRNGAGPGVPQDLTQADLIAIIGSIGPPMATTANKTNVAAAVASTVLLAANAVRTGASIYNDSPAELIVSMGATASATNFSVDMLPGAYFEVPANYTGVISGLWAAATGFARVTEYVP
jgi:hypothetical protein